MFLIFTSERILSLRIFSLIMYIPNIYTTALFGIVLLVTIFPVTTQPCNRETRSLHANKQLVDSLNAGDVATA